MKREFLQLAHKYSPKHHISGRFLSEKLDGQRFFWDGGVSRGVPIAEVPWANIEKSNSVPIATGMWSRYCKPINAPDWFLDQFPEFPIEGELWSGHGEFQKISSIVRSTVNQKDWSSVRAIVFDSPPPAAVFSDGEIKGTILNKSLSGALEWYFKRGGYEVLMPSTEFRTRLKMLEQRLMQTSNVSLLQQEQLPFKTLDAELRLEERLSQVLELGGEGLMLKSPSGLWVPERSTAMLKYKPFFDAEATVIGYTAGRETDKGSKLLGKMGALICKIKAGTFKLSGFTDADRLLTYSTGEDASDYVATIPGMIVPDHIHNPKFPIGSKITYKYRELSDDGIPKEARFWRILG